MEQNLADVAKIDESAAGRDNGITTMDDADPTVTNDDAKNDDISRDEQMSQESFQSWIADQLQSANPIVSQKYEHFLAGESWSIPACIAHWRHRFHGNPALWKRLFSKGRVVKEVVEALPIVQGVVRFVTQQHEQLVANNTRREAIVVDLCSGKGYLSMLLSEMLSRKLQPEDERNNNSGDMDNGNEDGENDADPSTSATSTGLFIRKFVLIDKQWPLHGDANVASPHHINWEHIYGTCPQTGQQYQWPIPLQTSKQNLKAGRTAKVLSERLFEAHKEEGEEPPIIIVLAVHLCGTLSIKAVEMFNDHPETVQWMALKPCCLPPPVFIKQKHVFTLGQHCFPAKDVCSGGRWKSNVWHGPPRHTLQAKFQVWVENLFGGIDLAKASATEHENNNDDHDDHPGEKCKVKVPVQAEGGYQNSFLFAERGAPGHTTLTPLLLGAQDQ
eukprot:CAMPEP_0168725490 /NCGR_PEP_ID=MMETSP0724-20121128/4182_1 /TAXON_ID=265536 /ORGANISM="Amphiprora sp., Strain CCMP467" /LENGTH=443 /DNA_ID=CAMNT_0008772279 /DNA_START=3 /DNA_END=1334 /DNA_ORIENTATION=-